MWPPTMPKLSARWTKAPSNLFSRLVVASRYLRYGPQVTGFILSDSGGTAAGSLLRATTSRSMFMSIRSWTSDNPRASSPATIDRRDSPNGPGSATA